MSLSLRHFYSQKSNNHFFPKGKTVPKGLLRDREDTERRGVLESSVLPPDVT